MLAKAVTCSRPEWTVEHRRYPGFTLSAAPVVLARVALGERLSFVQGIGIACALAAVVIIVATTG